MKKDSGRPGWFSTLGLSPQILVPCDAAEPPALAPPCPQHPQTFHFGAIQMQGRVRGPNTSCCHLTSCLHGAWGHLPPAYRLDYHWKNNYFISKVLPSFCISFLCVQWHWHVAYLMGNIAPLISWDHSWKEKNPWSLGKETSSWCLILNKGDCCC